MKLFCEDCLITYTNFRYVQYFEIRRCECHKLFDKTSTALFMDSIEGEYEKYRHRIYIPEDSVVNFYTDTFIYLMNGHQVRFCSRAIIPNIYISLGCIYNCRFCSQNRIDSNIAHLYKRPKTYLEILRDINLNGEEEEANAFMKIINR